MENYGFTKCLQNNPADLMMKYLETAKVRKQSQTLGLHGNAGSRGSINMIGSTVRPRYISQPRPTTPQLRVPPVQI
eukprot:6492730-Amphidinium_carterae.5